MPMRDEQALWCVEWGKRATEGRNYPDGFSLHKSLEDAEEYQKVNLQRSMTVTQWQGEPRVLLRRPYRCLVPNGNTTRPWPATSASTSAAPPPCHSRRQAKGCTFF